MVVVENQSIAQLAQEHRKYIGSDHFMSHRAVLIFAAVLAFLLALFLIQKAPAVVGIGC